MHRKASILSCSKWLKSLAWYCVYILARLREQRTSGKFPLLPQAFSWFLSWRGHTFPHRKEFDVRRSFENLLEVPLISVSIEVNRTRVSMSPCRLLLFLINGCWVYRRQGPFQSWTCIVTVLRYFSVEWKGQSENDYRSTFSRKQARRHWVFFSAA